MRYSSLHRINKSPQQVVFHCLATVREANLDCEEIVGKWEDHLVPLYGTDDLAMEFANCSNRPGSILRFVKKYGPLLSLQEPGAQFRETVTVWLDLQRRYRAIWNGLATREIRRRFGMTGAWSMGGDGGIFIFSERSGYGLTFKAKTLHKLPWLNLYARPAKNYRRCQNPHCKITPFFLSRDHRQRFCCDPCSGWSRKESKKLWWETHGKLLRKQGKKVRSEDPAKRRAPKPKPRKRK